MKDKEQDTRNRGQETSLVFGNSIIYRDVCKMLSNEPNDDECDATADDSSNAAGNIKN